MGRNGQECEEMGRGRERKGMKGKEREEKGGELMGVEGKGKD